MWSDGAPNFLIGLREGLEAGLVVSIVLATVARGEPGERRRGSTLVWAGLACAAVLSLAFGASLTFAAADLSTGAQEAVGGTLSLVAVAFVTWMVFWMRRSARTLSADLRTRTEAALDLGGRFLFGIAFFAVAREGLETALFLWSTTRTAQESTGPLLGATAGLAVAALLCWGLYRRALRINLSRFFTWTGAGLIVIAAGVTAYGIGELQAAGILGGRDSLAFDLAGPVDPASWYARLVEGTLNLTAQMTVAQVLAYLLYLVPVMALFVVMVRRSSAPVPRPAESVESTTALASSDPTDTADPTPRGEREEGGDRELTAARRQPVWLAVGAATIGVVVLTVVSVVVLGPKDSVAAATIEVTADACAPGWSPPVSGPRTFEIHNASALPVEVYLMDGDRVRAYGEIEGLGPGTTRSLAVDVAPGSYTWRCVEPDGRDSFSAIGSVTGDAVAATSYLPVTLEELDTSTEQYRALVAPGLTTLAADTDALVDAIARTGASDESRQRWLTAHLDYVRLGAAYGSFGDLDAAINGRPAGLTDGVDDPSFSGFLRLERELWIAPPGADPLATATKLAEDVHRLVVAFASLEIDPNDLPLRAHEILEDGVQFELTGQNDLGGHTNLATVRAEVDATRLVLGTIAAPLKARDPELLVQVSTELDALATTLDSLRSADGSWPSLDALSRAQRQRVNAAVSQMTEYLAPIPTILELPLSATGGN